MSHIIKIILELLNKIDFEGVIKALENIVEVFSDSIGPESADIIAGIGVAFYSYRANSNANKASKTAEDDEEAFDESQRAAEACLVTMGNLLRNNLSSDIY